MESLEELLAQGKVESVILLKGDWDAEVIEAIRTAYETGRAGRSLNSYAVQSHEDNIMWWRDFEGVPKERNKGELIALMHSELSEALEGERKDLMDDKLPHRRMAEVELADCLIRIFDYAAAYGYDLEGAYQEKRLYNLERADHKHEVRQQEGGKKW